MANNYKKDGFFTVKQVSDYFDIPITTLQTWHNTDYFKASVTVPVSEIDTYYYGAENSRNKGEVRFYSIDDVFKLNLIIILKELGIEEDEEALRELGIKEDEKDKINKKEKKNKLKKSYIVKAFMSKFENDPDLVFNVLYERLLKKISYYRKLVTFIEGMHLVGAKRFSVELSLRTKTIKEFVDDLPECELDDENSFEKVVQSKVVLMNAELANILEEIIQYKDEEGASLSDEFPHELKELLDKVNTWCDEYIIKNISNEDALEKISCLLPIEVYLMCFGESDGDYYRYIDENFGNGVAEFLKEVILNYVMIVGSYGTIYKKFEKRVEEEISRLEGEEVNLNVVITKKILPLVVEMMLEQWAIIIQRYGIEETDVNELFWTYIQQEISRAIEMCINMIGDEFGDTEETGDVNEIRRMTFKTVKTKILERIELKKER